MMAFPLLTLYLNLASQLTFMLIFCCSVLDLKAGHRNSSIQISASCRGTDVLLRKSALIFFFTKKCFVVKGFLDEVMKKYGSLVPLCEKDVMGRLKEVFNEDFSHRLVTSITTS